MTVEITGNIQKAGGARVNPDGNAITYAPTLSVTIRATTVTEFLKTKKAILEDFDASN